MEHVSNISKLVETLVKSERIHALVIESLPGWAKSTTIDRALKSLRVDSIAVGSYSTPLHLYNILCEHSSKVIVLDDCVGLFSDVRAMSILKAATWPSSGSQPERRITWGSTSEKVLQPEFLFSGKVILVTNAIPQGKETQAFLSRALTYRIRFTSQEAKQMLLEAAHSQEYFTDPALAKTVAQYLVKQLRDDETSSAINLRTLQMGYELAQTHPQSWQQLLGSTLTSPFSTQPPEELVLSLQGEVPGIREQEEKFRKLTGFSRRTFYNYRKKLGLARFYRESKD